MFVIALILLWVCFVAAEQYELDRKTRRYMRIAEHGHDGPVHPDIEFGVTS